MKFPVATTDPTPAATGQLFAWSRRARWKFVRTALKTTISHGDHMKDVNFPMLFVLLGVTAFWVVMIILFAR